MQRLLIRVAIAALCLFTPAIYAHDLPLSYVDLRVGESGLDAMVEAPAIDLAHDLPDVTPDILLTPVGADRQKEKLFSVLTTRLSLEADGKMLQAALLEVTPLVEQKDLRLRLRFAWSQPPNLLRINCRLFPYDTRHKTFLGIYRDNKLERQFIFDNDTTQIDYVATVPQGRLAVMRQFLFEGVHHIFIGPDHILFVVGLLLLGGTIPQLLKIVTAFTLAHSVTLVLAALDILSPPAQIIEPVIAMSIVFVGAHALLHRGQTRDWRLLFAFGFGLIHGFGFANVLRELQLPPQALGWSLFSFNAGVEIGQACIVLAAAPVLGFLLRRETVISRRLMTAACFGLIFAGAFWFAQRVF